MKLKYLVLCWLFLGAVAHEDLFEDWTWGQKIVAPAQSPSSLEEPSSREGHSLEIDLTSEEDDEEQLDYGHSKESSTFDYQLLPLGYNTEVDYTEETTTQVPEEGATYEGEEFEVTSESEVLTTLLPEDLFQNENGTYSDDVLEEETKKNESSVSHNDVATEGRREGRFLNIGKTLCSYGIGFNCEETQPVKSHYGASKLDKGQVFYGRPIPVNPHYAYSPYQVGGHLPSGYFPSYQSVPYPPLAFNRHGNVPTTTKAPASALDGILSIIEPFLPSSKPEATAKVSNGGFVAPPHGIPSPSTIQVPPPPPPYSPSVNQALESLLPTHDIPPPPPLPASPLPSSLHNPPPLPASPLPSSRPYIPLNTDSFHIPPTQFAAQTNKLPKPNFIFPQSNPVVPQESFIPPKQNTEPNVVQVVPFPAKPIQPTIAEVPIQAFIYDEQSLPKNIYSDDHYGLLQSVHNSINQMNKFSSIHRKDITKVTNHIDIPVDSESAPSSNNVVEHRPVERPASLNIVPAVLESGSIFRPGKIERGFKPLPSTRQQSASQHPLYPEDCQCLPRTHCSRQNVVLPSHLRNLIDARNKGTNVLSTDHSSENITSLFVREEELGGQSFARRGRLLTYSEEDYEDVTDQYAEETIEVTTEMEGMEETTTSPFEETFDLSDGDESEEENIDDTGNSVRQGRQLNGFIPRNTGCGPNHVCCRRTAFKAREEQPLIQQTQQLQYTCGKRNANGIFGRVNKDHSSPGNAEFGEYPWQAAILKRENGELLYQCGGTLINNKYILTAAHCVIGLHESTLMVRLGEWDISGETEFYKHVEYRVSGLYIHHDYSRKNLNNDIAVIRLENLVDFASNPHITPVCLPSKQSDFANYRCFATGWGRNTFVGSGKISHVLKAIEVPVLEKQRCQQILQNTRFGVNFVLPEGNICAGEENRDTCTGDGGGPLVCQGLDGNMQLAGLLSWGIGCGQQGIPGVYVKVSHYLDWINNITRE